HAVDQLLLRPRARARPERRPRPGRVLVPGPEAAVQGDGDRDAGRLGRVRRTRAPGSDAAADRGARRTAGQREGRPGPARRDAAHAPGVDAHQEAARFGPQRDVPPPDRLPLHPGDHGGPAGGRGGFRAAGSGPPARLRRMPARVRVSVAGVSPPENGPAPLSPRAVERLLRRAVRVTLATQGVARGEFSLALLSDAAIAELNERYLGHEGPTDVLSFPLYEGDEPPVGDVYIGYEQALRQAAALGVPPAEELARLAIHGTLHVLGYDHPEGAGRVRSRMWKTQERILREVIGQ